MILDVLFRGRKQEVSVADIRFHDSVQSNRHIPIARKRNRRITRTGVVFAAMLALVLPTVYAPAAISAPVSDPTETVQPDGSATQSPTDATDSAPLEPDETTPEGQVPAPSTESTATAPRPSPVTGQRTDAAPRKTAASSQALALEAAQYAPTCEAGAVFALSGSGQIRVVSSSGAVSDFGTAASRVSRFNGLGIGQGGESAYAYERTSSGRNSSVVANIWSFDTTTGQWSSTGHAIDSTNFNRTVVFIGGAVDLSTGHYYLGGFNSRGTQFQIWEYDPTTNSSTYKGYADTSRESGGSANGDLAFDKSGNAFIVRGSGTSTTVFSVTAANLAAATGGLIPSSHSASVTTMNNVNGVAFDSDGKVYLGSGDELRSYNMPNFAAENTVVSYGLGSSTDLASCSSPPTITIEKFVDGERVNATDQFALSLDQAESTLATATTSGNASGLQNDRIGPLPTARNVQLSFSESAALGTNMADYASSYRCEVDGVLDPAASGNGTSGTITIPATGDDVTCTFYNSQLTSSISITKYVADSDGANPVLRANWPVTASVTSASGAVSTSPVATTQRTSSEGIAHWTANYAAGTESATVAVSEQMLDGFVFDSGVCRVEGLDGSVRSVELSGADPVSISGIDPGDRVDCSYTNRVAPTMLTLEKVVDANFDPDAGANQWMLSASGPNGVSISGLSGSTAVTEVEVPAGSYALSEQLSGEHASKSDGYVQQNLTCVDSATDSALPVTDGNVVLVDGSRAICTFTNADLPGSISWNKVVEGTSQPLFGSHWTISGPSFPDGSDVAGDADGNFIVEDLKWGQYTVTETSAPAGYELGDPAPTFTVTVAPPTLDVEQGAIGNVQVREITLPIAGGSGTWPYVLVGSVLIGGAGLAWVLLWRRNSRRTQIPVEVHPSTD